MMSTLVIIYFFIFAGLSYFASRFASTVDGFCVANRELGTFMMIGVTVISWFDADNILGAPATFIEKGLSSTYADPVGSAACLMLIGLFVGRYFYQKNTISLGTLYENAYGTWVSRVSMLIIIVSYIGWMAGQFLAIGLLVQILSHGYISLRVGACISAIFIIIYLIQGGMWAMAMGNVFQMVVLITSLLISFWEIAHQTGGVSTLLKQAVHDTHFSPFPSHDAKSLIGYFSDFMTMALGALPQQDIFQNVCSCRNVNVVKRSFVVGGLLFLILCYFPMLTAYGGMLLEHTQHVTGDPQMFLPNIILHHTGLIVQTIFFGAIFSALIGSSPSALLAPAVSLCDFLPAHIRTSDRRYLFWIRVFIVVLGVGSLLFLLCSSADIYNTITGAYKITFVAAAVPLLAAQCWSKSNRTGAWTSIILGCATWMLQEWLAPDTLITPELTGFLFSFAGIIVGTYAERLWKGRNAWHATNDKLLSAEPEVRIS